jgi:DNA-binding NtrC family response regulator
MDGIDVLRAIKKEQPSTQVILLTGHASVETSIEGMQHGAYDYLLKPVKFEELLIKIAAACEHKMLSAKKFWQRASSLQMSRWRPQRPV